MVVGYEFFAHPKPPDPYQAVNITDDAGYTEASKEALAFSSATFPKIQLGGQLNEQDIQNLTKSIQLYDGMLAYKPGNPLPGLTAGEAFLALQKNDRAIDRFKQFLTQSSLINDSRLKVAQADAHFLMSKAYFNEHNYQTALDEVNVALAAYPKASAYLTQKASIYLQMNQVDQARTFAKAAIAIDPTDSHAKGILSLIGDGSSTPKPPDSKKP